MYDLRQNLYVGTYVCDATYIMHVRNADVYSYDFIMWPKLWKNQLAFNSIIQSALIWITLLWIFLLSKFWSNTYVHSFIANWVSYMCLFKVEKLNVNIRLHSHIYVCMYIVMFVCICMYVGIKWVFPQCLWTGPSVQLLQGLFCCWRDVSGRRNLRDHESEIKFFTNFNILTL